MDFQNTPLEQLLEEGLRHHRVGELAQAEGIYREILGREPGFADAWHLLGAMASQHDKNEAAVELIGRAISINPRHPAYHSNLGEALRKCGKFEQAEAAYRRAIGLNPAFGDAYTNLGVMLITQGREKEALGVYQMGVRSAPGHAGVHRFLGDLFIKEKRLEEAIHVYRDAVRLDPSLSEAWFNLGLALMETGRPREAVGALTKGVALMPEDVQSRRLLAEALANSGDAKAALAEFQRVVSLDSMQEEAWVGQGNAWRDLGGVDEAIAAYRRAVELKPGDALARANLGCALRDHAEMDEAIAELRRAVEDQPEKPQLQSALIFTMQLHPKLSSKQIEVEQRKWNQMYVDAVVGSWGPHANDRSPERRLRVGYVSFDLRRHPVGRFMRPLLEHYDRSQVEVFGYSSTHAPDRQTDMLRGLMDQWRHVAAVEDAPLAEMIRADGIDVLVDLCMHTGQNRMALFALKPAPVQVSYLAYCGGTRVKAMDYYLTDRWISPVEKDGDVSGAGAGLNEPQAEPGAHVAGVGYDRPLWLPETYWCYEAHRDAGDVMPSPALARASQGNGGVTFGSLNYFSKVNDGVLEVWAELLGRVKGSRLVLHVPWGSRLGYVREFFAKRGVAEERLELLGRLSEKLYFEQYGKIDIALDPFPMPGGTTTCDALWMGVPVVTLAGEAPLTRGGVSILSNVGLENLVARTPEEYIAKAVRLAEDLGRLVELRRTLRERMRGTALMDAPRFARALEEAYRQAWRAWCLR